MEKIVKTTDDLLSFDFSQLKPQKTNYVRFIPDNENLPKVREDFEREMRVSEKNHKKEPEITFEISPRWFTTIIYDGARVRRNEFQIDQISGYDSKILTGIILKIFDIKKPG